MLSGVLPFKRGIAVKDLPYPGGFKSLRWKWYGKYKKWVKIEEDNNTHLTNFTILNEAGEEIH